MTAADEPKASPRSAQVIPLSVKAYHAAEKGLIPEKTELLYGQVYQKIAKSPIHRLLVMRLLELLRRALPPGYHVQSEQPVACGDSEPEPDLSVIRGSIEDYRSQHPATAEFVLEVCVSSQEYDRFKLRAYASAGVKEVWLVLVPEKQIEVHRQPASYEFDQTTLHRPGGHLASAAIPSFSVELGELFK